ncbi:unnamed protein product [Toxocara canis]|uniref:Uncharacterized protein n=1 Tax=Toxocara canis TaxID=6265 RepID=A0A183UEX0_TOXCA|nr:unnamed protein product [Toxocara canis]
MGINGSGLYYNQALAPTRGCLPPAHAPALPLSLIIAPPITTIPGSGSGSGSINLTLIFPLDPSKESSSSHLHYPNCVFV